MPKSFCCLLLALLFCSTPVFAEGDSFREKLVSEKQLGYVTPLGDRLTYIKGVNAVYNAYPSLVRFALEQGGVPEVQVDGRWTPIELIEDTGWMSDGFYYIHPVSGEKEPFGYGEMITNWDPCSGNGSLDTSLDYAASRFSSQTCRISSGDLKAFFSTRHSLL